MKKKLAILIVAVNCAAALLLAAVLTGIVSLGERTGERSAATGPASVDQFSKEDAKILRDRNILKDKKKFEATLESLKKKVQAVDELKPRALS